MRMPLATYALGAALFVWCTSPARANSYNGKNEILNVTIHDSGHVLILLASASNTENCASPNLGNLIVIPNTNPNFRMMYATALTALSTGRPLEGWVNGCLDLWGGNSNKVAVATTMTLSK